MEQLTFNKTFVNSFHDVLDHVLRVLLKPNLIIGLGNGTIIDLMVEWIINNRNSPELKNIAVWCTEKCQVAWLQNAGIKAAHGLPTRSAHDMHIIDYFFEMPEQMTQDFGFVKVNPFCEIRQFLFKKAKESVFFYHYKNGKKFPQINAIPIEVAKVYEKPIKRYLNTKTTFIELATPNYENHSTLRCYWKLTPNGQNSSTEPHKDMSTYAKGLYGYHGIVAHGYYSKVGGCLVEIAELSNEEMYMTIVPMNN